MSWRRGVGGGANVVDENGGRVGVAAGLHAGDGDVGRPIEPGFFGFIVKGIGIAGMCGRSGIGGRGKSNAADDKRFQILSTDAQANEL